MAPEAGPLDRVLWRILADLLDSPSGPLKCKGAHAPGAGQAFLGGRPDKTSVLCRSISIILGQANALAPLVGTDVRIAVLTGGRAFSSSNRAGLRRPSAGGRPAVLFLEDARELRRDRLEGLEIRRADALDLQGFHQALGRRVVAGIAAAGPPRPGGRGPVPTGKGGVLRPAIRMAEAARRWRPRRSQPRGRSVSRAENVGRLHQLPRCLGDARRAGGAV